MAASLTETFVPTAQNQNISGITAEKNSTVFVESNATYHINEGELAPPLATPLRHCKAQWITRLANALLSAQEIRFDYFLSLPKPRSTLLEKMTILAAFVALELKSFEI
jgi:hypothetical protein